MLCHCGPMSVRGHRRIGLIKRVPKSAVRIHQRRCRAEPMVPTWQWTNLTAGAKPTQVIKARPRDRGPKQEIAMDIAHPRVAGLRVHKKIILVAVRLSGEASASARWWW
jgi:hypothetical protein